MVQIIFELPTESNFPNNLFAYLLKISFIFLKRRQLYLIQYFDLLFDTVRRI